jgi:phosphatidylserine/phosphatidylglycerophosphate/cardiolipin synthase-like enzyme
MLNGALKIPCAAIASQILVRISAERPVTRACSCPRRRASTAIAFSTVAFFEPRMDRGSWTGSQVADDRAPLGRQTRSLPDAVKGHLARFISDGEIDLGSTADVRSRLGLGTSDAARISAEYRNLTESLGAEVARGVLLGICSAGGTGVDPQLVWTGSGMSAAARTTAQVIEDVVHGAQHRLVVVGYSLTPAAAPFVRSLADAVRRGVQCSLVADRMEGKLATIHTLWPKDLGFPMMWTRPADPADEQSALHAKFLVADARRLFLTSANLTYHGFHGNLEVGVLLEGAVAADAENLVREWSRAKLIRRVEGPTAGSR